MIENLLDENGRGLLTKELDRIFTVGGCRPMCHVCHKFLKLNFKFRLKMFAEEVTFKEEKKSLDIMICGECDESDKLLPYEEFVKAAASLGIKFPKYHSKPEQYDKKKSLYDEILKKYGSKAWREKETDWWGNTREVEVAQWLLWTEDNKIRHIDYNQFSTSRDLPYLKACDDYHKQVQKLHKKFTQYFENENYVNYCVAEKKRQDAAHRRYVASLPKRGGCFILKTGGTSKII